MTLTLSTRIQKLIDRHLRSGQYQTAEDVVAAALANMDQQERLSRLPATEFLKAFPRAKQKLAEGLAAVRAGKMTDGEKFFDDLAQEEKRSSL
jgi:Arc/MetJ-type ribon-helix-helix transcriptional regulator